jgi:hypothetical protein
MLLLALSEMVTLTVGVGVAVAVDEVVDEAVVGSATAEVVVAVVVDVGVAPTVGDSETLKVRRRPFKRMGRTLSSFLPH